MKTKSKIADRIWVLPPLEVIRHQKRVLKLVDAYLRRQRQDLLVTDGRGLMTWGEIREHVRAAAYCLKPAARAAKQRRKHNDEAR